MTTTTYGKGSEGAEGTTMVPLPELGENRAIRIHTGKAGRGGVSTSATAVKIEPSSHGLSGYSFQMFGDFHKGVTTDPKARCTEKLVRLQHEFVLSDIDALKASVLKFYADKKAKEMAEAA